MSENIQFGIEVPRNHQHAMAIDRKNGNTKWYKSEETEVQPIFDYITFIDKGKGNMIPDNYTKISVHIVYAVNMMVVTTQVW